jgi:hypothetical protein
VFDTADDIGFWIVVCIAAALALVVMLIAGRWLRDKGFGPQ